MAQLVDANGIGLPNRMVCVGWGGPKELNQAVGDGLSMKFDRSELEISSVLLAGPQSKLAGIEVTADFKPKFMDLNATLAGENATNATLAGENATNATLAGENATSTVQNATAANSNSNLTSDNATSSGSNLTNETSIFGTYEESEKCIL